ncbi:hypothetical protein DPEC_G00007730 [Dallia pectoralis]|uniref:Uncharacterized protein n=1 Tax=Dallia pectoralis TaxID=75939 RepID=A0ACC2HKQ1_DALPE|nr:hypothetical protein DPEC_G00007730 [Dallia pectoralis]
MIPDLPWLLQGHLGEEKYKYLDETSGLSRGSLTFSCGICTSCKGFNPQAPCLETREAAVMPNLTAEKCPGPAKHPAPVISDRPRRVSTCLTSSGYAAQSCSKG